MYGWRLRYGGEDIPLALADNGPHLFWFQYMANVKVDEPTKGSPNPLVPLLPFQDKLRIQSLCSLGIDCHVDNSASIPAEMRLYLQSLRGLYNQALIDQGNVPARVDKTVEEAFNLCIISGPALALPPILHPRKWYAE